VTPTIGTGDVPGPGCGLGPEPTGLRAPDTRDTGEGVGEPTPAFPGWRIRDWRSVGKDPGTDSPSQVESLLETRMYPISVGGGVESRPRIKIAPDVLRTAAPAPRLEVAHNGKLEEIIQG